MKTTFVAHITVDTPDGADPATWMTAVERALRFADVVNPPGVTGLQLDEARIDVVDVIAPPMAAGQKS